MEHSYWEEKVQAYIDVELRPADMAAFDQHLEECPTCKKDVAYFRAMKQRLRAHRDSISMPAEVEARLKKNMRRPKILRLVQPYYLAASALAAVLLFALFLGFPPAQTYDLVSGTLSGRIICHDCEIATACDQTKGIFCADTHRFGLKTDDGKLWRVLMNEKGHSINTQGEIYNKEVIIKGQIEHKHRLIVIERLISMDQVKASLDAITSPALTLVSR